ncbi:MAG: cobyric acid synthase, partial [Actinobacteria bacterium]|nr:cobyric acid synthase [Actinomycetota bacterium]
GKSVLVAGLCRLLARSGLKTAPFKAQNMALNSAVTPCGGEIGRAQAAQAFAARIEPAVDMNPILIKPSSDTDAQVIVLGKPIGNLSAVDYHERKLSLWNVARSAYDRLAAAYEVVVIEGAGSPAEINLKDRDIVNMKTAEYAGAPVVIVADIDKGGVFASLVGTMELLDSHEKYHVKGFVINKFRGDLSLLRPGLEFIENKTGVPVLGVVPYLNFLIEEEDEVKAGPWSTGRCIDITVVGLPHLSNFTDLNPLSLEPDVSLRMVRKPGEFGYPDAIIMPGSKNTIADLMFIKERGLAARIKELASGGTPVIGICGGYQMLGRMVYDPHGVESELGEIEGLGLLEVESHIGPEKSTRRSTARCTGGGPILGRARGRSIRGYEIHMGSTERLEGSEAAFEIERDGSLVSDGAVDESGLIIGAYLHGLFDDESFRSAFLEFIRERKGIQGTHKPLDYRGYLDKEMDRLADHLSAHLDFPMICRLAGIDTGTKTHVR